MDLKLGQVAKIRAFRAEDAEAVQRYADNRKIWLNLRDLFPHPYTIETARGFMSFLAGQKPLTTFAIATESEAVGCIGLHLGEDVHRKTAEVGYWLGEAYWGRGIMTAAVAAFTDWAFGNFDLERIYAQPFGDNVASARVLEKAGFMCEGRLRANAFKDGKVLDTLMYSRLRAQ
jgi:[ribosomal protein S5]-alanine N-acetyltransferase